MIQKARCEKLAEQDLHSDIMQDLKMQAIKEREGKSIFIQKIDMYPMSIYLFSDESMRALNVSLKNDYVRLNFDATGGIIRTHDGSPVLNHILLLSKKSHNDNKVTVPFNIAELMTVDNSGFNIGNFLRHFTVKFKLMFPSQEKIAHSIVTDKAFANLNAIIESQNEMKLKTYLNIMFQKYVGTVDENSFKKLTLVFLCASHQSKNWKDDIFNFYKGSKTMNKDDKYYVCALIGMLMNISTKEDFDEYLKALFTLFCNKGTDEVYIKAFETIRKIAGDLDKSKTDYEKNDNDREQISTEADDSSSNVIYKSSKFYIYYNILLKETTDSLNEQDEIQNKFFNPAYAYDFLKKNLAYVPLWARMFTEIGMHEYKRPTNAYVESHNHIIKSTLQKDHTLHLGSIRMNRYINVIRQNQLKNFSLINNQIRDHHVARKKHTKRNEETHDSLPTLMEEWGGKAREEATIFFDPQKVQTIAGICFQDNLIHIF